MKLRFSLDLINLKKLEVKITFFVATKASCTTVAVMTYFYLLNKLLTLKLVSKLLPSCISQRVEETFISSLITSHLASPACCLLVNKQQEREIINWYFL